MTIQYPVCPACGRRFDIAGVYRPKGDGTDVIGFTHHDADQRCPDVWATAENDPKLVLTRLGTIDDYGDWIALLKESEFRADIRLGPEGKLARLGFEVRQWFRRQRRRFS